MHGKCICQICTCGRHRCPHRGSASKPIQVECTLTEYQNKYKEWTSQPRRASLRPPRRDHTNDMPMDMESTYVAAFVPHENSRPEALRPNKANMVIPANLPMELRSTYDKDFTGETTKRVESFKPKRRYDRKHGGFNSKTMYQASYKDYDLGDWDWCRGQPMRHKECIEMNTDKFAGTSTQKEDYKKHEKWEKRGLIKPKHDRVQGGQFSGSTTYTTEFVPKKGESPAMHSPPQHRPFPDAPFAGETTVKADYVTPQGHQQVASFKPVHEYNPSKTPFTGKTTANTAYRAWSVQKPETPEWGKQKQWSKPKEGLDKNSLYKEAYTAPPKDYKRVQLAKPGGEDLTLATHADPSRMERLTHYKEQYVPFSGATREQSFKVIQRYEPPSEKMPTESTYRGNYTGEQTQRSSACRPVQAKPDKGRMHFSTTYKDTYHGERPKSCPATELVPKGNATEAPQETTAVGSKHLTFTLEKHGHKFYTEEAQPKRAD